MDIQDVPATPDAPVTSLLSLPNELLVRIARSVAPDGGRQVGALRLTCRRVERVVSHIAWSSIHIQSDPKLHNPLLAILNSDTGGRGAQVTSVLNPIHPVTLRKLRLLHVPRLFDTDSTPDGEALVLDTLSNYPITELSLPVISVFHTGPELSALVMSNVTTLTLETDPSAPFDATPDLYTHRTHTTLTTFLSTSFPNLTTLHLTGWFDTTGIQVPATATPRVLSTQFPFVCLLLNALRWTGVVAITLKSSNGHADGDRECRFTRADSDAPEWTARLVQYI
ncbi:hypothetical protein RQP46_001913 [Phenoliferia psychrophenolica]